MYRVSEEEIQAAQAKYKKEYRPFRPFTLPPMDSAHISAAFYNIITTQNGMDTDDYCVPDNNKVERYIGDLGAGAKVLLLGVGTGRETVVAKGLGYSAVGTTLGSRNIDFGGAELGLSSSEHMECINEALPFPSNTFDCVAGFQVFEHAIAPLLFLLEQSRVLKMGGQLFLEWPPADNYSMEDNPHHQVCFTPGQAHALFQKAGFGGISVFYDDLSEIPQDKWWGGEHDKMLCIRGEKVPCGKAYIQRAWGLR